VSDKFFIETWGCQMNDLDTQRLSGSLKLRGWQRVENEQDASLILLNTCSIREKSEQKVFSRLGELRELKRETGARVGVAGCVAQQEGERILQRAPWVDFVMGPGNVGYLDEILGGTTRVATDFPEDRRYD
jgi:tRNA-2-methylthio-N6-dimethylallyladenosine synthase